MGEQVGNRNGEGVTYAFYLFFLINDRIVYSMDIDLETAIRLLRSAEEQNMTTYLKGCVNYINRMKPDQLEVPDAGY